MGSQKLHSLEFSLPVQTPSPDYWLDALYEYRDEQGGLPIDYAALQQTLSRLLAEVPSEVRASWSLPGVSWVRLSKVLNSPFFSVYS